MSRVLYYKCKRCGNSIEPNTKKKLVFCRCGKIGIDGTLTNSRIVGDKNFVEVVRDEKVAYAYRIKHVPTGLYYTPYNYPSSAKFTEKGKLYTRKPSLSWAAYLAPVEECVIEKYELSLV